MSEIELMNRSPSMEIDSGFEDHVHIPISPCEAKRKLKAFRREYFKGMAFPSKQKRKCPFSATESTLVPWTSESKSELTSEQKMTPWLSQTQSIDKPRCEHKVYPLERLGRIQDIPTTEIVPIETTNDASQTTKTVPNLFKKEIFKSLVDLSKDLVSSINSSSKISSETTQRDDLMKKQFYRSLQSIPTEFQYTDSLLTQQNNPVQHETHVKLHDPPLEIPQSPKIVIEPPQLELVKVNKPVVFDLEFDEEMSIPEKIEPRKKVLLSTCDSGIGDDDVRSLSRGSIFTLSDEDEVGLPPPFASEEEVLCGNRVSQMTKTYNDIDAVTTLLQEKERDLELAARIGQQLLSRNKVLEDKVSNLEGDLANASEQITQLRHDLQMKVDLLQIYTNDFDESSVESTPTGIRHFNVDTLQRKVECLEHENRDLRNEASQLALDTQDCEDKEKKLVADVIEQLEDAHKSSYQLSDELAKKIEENLRFQEDIQNYHTQCTELQGNNKRLTHENEEINMLLGVTRECQDELTTELAGFKEKYTEVLDLLHDTQEQLRRAQKKNTPGMRGSSHYNIFSSHSGNDSIANELHSMITGPDEISSDGARNLSRVFDTVRTTGRGLHGDLSSNATPTRLPIHLTTNLHTTDSKGYYSSYANNSTYGSSGIASLESGTDSDVSMYQDSDDAFGRNRLLDVERLRCSLPYGCRTPDSIMSTGSGRLSSASAGADWKIPQKLQIVKPLEGSNTLNQWSRLATPHLGGLLEDREGVAVKGAAHCNLTLEPYSMSDFEEDEEDGVCQKGFPGKQFMHTSGIYTYTNCTVLHPDDVTNLTTSLQPVQSSILPSSTASQADPLPSAPPTPSHGMRSRRGSTSTFSTHSTLAKHLKERGTELSGIPSTATPANSPTNSGSGSPDAYSYKLPGIEDLTKKIHYGARLLRRTIYGGSPPSSVTKMNLVEKVQAMGVDNLVGQTTSPGTTGDLGLILGAPARPGAGNHTELPPRKLEKET